MIEVERKYICNKYIFGGRKKYDWSKNKKYVCMFLKNYSYEYLASILSLRTLTKINGLGEPGLNWDIFVS